MALAMMDKKVLDGLLSEKNDFVADDITGGTGRFMFHLAKALENKSQNKSCGKCTRKLLCKHCNAGLGYFKDNENILLKSVEYLKSYKKTEDNCKNQQNTLKSVIE